MNIDTKFHGNIAVDPEAVYQFDSGLPGFLDEKEFVLLDLEGTPFQVLQSTKTSAVAFVLVNPFEITDYQVKLTDEILEALSIQSEEDVAVYAILNVREPFYETTANLQAPVIFNARNKKGKQFITNDKQYAVRHLFLQKEAK